MALTVYPILQHVADM